MTIFIYAREEIEQLIEKEFPTKTAVISFYDPPVGSHEARPVDFCGKAGRLFQAAVWDIHYDELEDYGLRYEDYFPEAEKLASFIADAEKDGWDIICQCEYGQSRSAGCAAAIREFYEESGISIFADYRYCPNQMIYHKVYDALVRL